MLRDYKELTAWQKAYQLCLDVYRVTRKFPKEEIYNLTAQARRAALSVPSNIAEGYGKRTGPDYIKSLYIAYGSVCELETQIMLARDLNYLSDSDAENSLGGLAEVERMLKALIRSLEKKHSTLER